jgi:hypothetical protein
MNFDDELQRAFATLADRLRDDITREVSATAAGLRAAAPSGAGPTDPAVALRDHIRALDRAASLADTLNLLTVAASSYAPRVATWLVQRDRYRAWHVRGFDAALEGIELVRAAAGCIADAAKSGEPAECGNGGRRPPAFAGLPARALACPLRLGNDTVAVVYADTGSADDLTSATSFSEAAIEILCRHAARKLEALTAFMAAREAVGGVQPDAIRDAEGAARQANESAAQHHPILKAG